MCLQPKFLTKEERAAEAIKRRQEQVDAQRRVIDDEHKKQEEFMKAAKESAGRNILCSFKCHILSRFHIYSTCNME